MTSLERSATGKLFHAVYSSLRMKQRRAGPSATADASGERRGFLYKSLFAENTAATQKKAQA